MQIYNNLIFSIKLSLILIKKILKKNGKILIIYLDPKIIYLFKNFNLSNCFIFVKWTPGLFTNNIQKKPDLILLFDYFITFEKITEIYKLNIPIIFFTSHKNIKIQYLLYSFKYIINIKNIFLFLVLLQKIILLNSYDNFKIKKKKIR